MAAKTLAQITTQAQELIGDYRMTTFEQAHYTEAINWAVDLLIRLKGFKVSYSPAIDIGSYPTGKIPASALAVKRINVVIPDITTPTDPMLDEVIKTLRESTVALESATNETWRNRRATFAPRRWVRLGNLDFVVVPPKLPTTPPSGSASWKIRIEYIDRSTPMALVADTVDPSVPEYYQEAIRYAAVAYLMEKDTDLASENLRNTMLKSFMVHINADVQPLAETEEDK